MRKLLVALLLFGLGIGGAVIVARPAGAHTLNTTLTGSVGSSGSANAFTITLSATDLPDGTYDFDITDYATAHNFDLCPGSARCTSGNSIFKTSIAGTGEQTFANITLTDGEYTYQCDQHASMTKHLFVGSATTTTTTTTHTTTTSPTTTQSTTTAPTTTTTHTTTTTTTTPTTTTHTTTTTPAPAPLRVSITSAKGTAHAVTVKVKSSKHGKGTASLWKGKKKIASASHTVPGTIVIKHALKPGSYTVKVSVTAAGKHAAAKKTVKIR